MPLASRLSPSASAGGDAGLLPAPHARCGQCGTSSPRLPWVPLRKLHWLSLKKYRVFHKDGPKRPCAAGSHWVHLFETRCYWGSFSSADCPVPPRGSRIGQLFAVTLPKGRSPAMSLAAMFPGNHRTPGAEASRRDGGVRAWGLGLRLGLRLWHPKDPLVSLGWEPEGL